MKRDGKRMSIWQSDLEHQSTPIDATAQFDFKIKGSGLTALTTALLLQQQGKKCLLVTDTGASHFPLAYLSTMQENGYTRLAADAAKSTLLADSARAALDLAESWVTEHSIDCGFVYEPGFLYSKNNNTALAEEQAAAEKSGLVITSVQSIPVPVPFEAACRFEFQARLHPVQFYNGLLSAFTKAGGAVTDQDDRAAGINITTDATADLYSCNMAFTLSEGTYPYGIAESRDEHFAFQATKIDGQDFVIATCYGAASEAEGFKHLEDFVSAHFKVQETGYKWSVPYAAVPQELFSVKNTGNDFSVSGLGSNAFTNSIIAGQLIADKISGRQNPAAVLFSDQQ
jgi:glycine/D-amino acid oxidase-like deaminating enzyme